jgi:hypothetical protein
LRVASRLHLLPNIERHEDAAMRRTRAVHLSLLPFLASAALARAQEEPLPQWGTPDPICGEDPECQEDRRRAEAEVLEQLPTVLQDGSRAFYLVLPQGHGGLPYLRRGFGYFFPGGG